MRNIPIPERLQILKHNEGWFGRAPDRFQDAVLSHSKWLTFAAGEPVYQATDRHVNLCGIVDGAVEMYSRFGAGDNPLLHVGHEGFWMGYGTIIERSRPRISAVACVDTLMASTPDHVLKSLLKARPEWWPIMVSAFMEYGDLATTAYADSLLAEHDRRCASVLLRITGLSPPRRSCPERADVPITQHELATMTQVSRTSLAKILKRFETHGLVRRGYRTLRVTDEHGLRAIAVGAFGNDVARPG